MNFEEHTLDNNIDGMEVQDLEPVPRERSNTWHGDFMYLDSHTQTFPVIPEKVASSGGNVVIKLENDFRTDGDDEGTIHIGTNSIKKGSVRRNAWGNASYAELIAQAIESSAEKRLTLTQIYDWMIKNIPYFQQRSDGPSSMGWKNSIRHNLSLHNQFSRVQNEGTGKSSWWVVNRNFVKNKVPRRRATMGDSTLMDKKRCRVNKRLKCLETDIQPTVDDHSRKIKTISEANEVVSENDHKLTSNIKKSLSQTVITSSFIDDSEEQLKSMEKIISSEAGDEVMHWPKMGNTTRLVDESTSPVDIRPQDSCSVESYATHSPQHGLCTSNTNQSSIILRVQPTNAQKKYFETGNLSPPILFYVSSTEKNNLLMTTNQSASIEQTQNSMAVQNQIQISYGISKTTLSDLNKQTNQMSLGDSGPCMNKPAFHVSEKRQKMLMDLLHSERFCQLRRQNPELNRKIIDMLQRKKNMLLKKNTSTNGIQEHRTEQSLLYHNVELQRTQSFVPECQPEWLKHNTLDEAQSNIFPSSNISDTSSAKPDLYTNSLEFGHSNNFQIDVDQTIGDIEFDGSIDDLFGTNCLLLNCDDELNILSHEFS